MFRLNKIRRMPLRADCILTFAQDYTLTSEIWNEVQLRFGDGKGHSCDLMALYSNAVSDRLGRPLPHFTPYPCYPY